MTRHFFLIFVFFNFHEDILGQQSSNGCSQYMSNVHRMGANVNGRLEIPVDRYFPKYKLRIGFSSPIHHMSIRQVRAKDTGTHREFIVDPMEAQRDGKMQLDFFVRLHRPFGQAPRLNRIVYNNVALCGDPVNASEIDGAFVQLAIAPTRRPLPILTPKNVTIPNNIEDEEEDIFR